MRSTYTTIDVDPDLIGQVLRELLAMATDPNLVEVTDAEFGRVILAHPDLAEAWYQQALARETKTEDSEPEVVAESTSTEEVVAESTNAEEPPVKRGPGRPRKVVFASASNGEEPQ
jgi:hypothetical protein